MSDNPQDAKRAEILLEFTFWLEDFVKQQDLGSDAYKTAFEIRHKLDEIKERIF